MSRFFRSADSSSSSASDLDESDQDDDNQLSASQLIERPAQDQQSVQRTSNETQIVLASDQVDTVDGTSRRDLLLHALLEERCLRQATDDLGSTASIDRIRQIAQQQYATLASRLAAYGLVEPGYDSAAFSTHRQAARDGLDALSRSRQDDEQAYGSATQLALGFGALQLSRPQLEMLSPPGLRPPPTLPDLLRLGDSPSIFSAASLNYFHGSRYQREFEEVCTLGRGGYGIVYQCKHRFDGLSYAVKKVPLSTTRLQKIRDEGQAEVDRLLLELTTLARLDHPNIVRYFGGWVEMATLGQHAVMFDGSDAGGGASERPFSYASTEQSTTWRVAEVNDDDFISFETSTSGGAHSFSRTTTTSASGETLQRTSTKNTQATVSDVADTESLPRSAEEHSTLSTFAQSAAPCLALHIQMGLYPLSLADFLAGDNTSAMPRHCFHLEPSLRILSALIEGVTYLHSQGVVHRDLKPANVFLAQHINHKQIWCRQCSEPTNAVKVRIGDFGLVAALDVRDDHDPITPVGTELYRPHNAIDRYRLEALDWFALGVIGFELLSPFSTRMERHDALTQLRNGHYPVLFTKSLGSLANDVAALIGHLLRNDQIIDAHSLQCLIDSLLEKC